jgi:hypothetical protein
MGLEEGKEGQQKDYVNYSNNNRKFPKSRENYVYTCTEGLQNTKQT